MSFGDELRRERELRQISLREVSEATKINLRYLDALEKNDFRHLPGGVFNKGFVRAYSEFIGIDPEGQINAYLLEEQSQQARADEKTREALRRTGPAEPSRTAASPWSRRLGVWIALAVLLLAAIGAVTAWILLPGGSPFR